MKQAWLASLAFLFVLPGISQAQKSKEVPLHGQCGGVGYTGPKECANPNFPQQLIVCKPRDATYSSCEDISDPECVKVACKCALGWVTEWYTGPPPQNCRLCNCVPAPSTKPVKPTLTLSTPSVTTTTSDIIYPFYPPAPIYSSSCPKATCPSTCRVPAATLSYTETVHTPGIKTECAQCTCLCPIFDCFCRPPAVYLPSTYGNCLACTCSTPALSPSAVPEPGEIGGAKEDLSRTVTAFLERVEGWRAGAKQPEGGEAGVWRRRAAMPEVTVN